MTTSGAGRLQDLHAVITGAASGIGAAAADLFAAEGALVVACDIADATPVVAEITARGGRAIAVRCDVADPTDVRSMAESVIAEHGPVHVLFNNAGTLTDDAPADTLDPLQASRIIGVNLLGMIHTCRYFLPDMLTLGRGSIISTSSIGGLVGTASSHAYCASKGGVISYTRALAVAYGSHGVRANVICPGPTRTGISRELGENWERERAARVPLGRVAEPHEIANVALFLASSESSYMTGAVLAVDGGRTAE